MAQRQRWSALFLFAALLGLGTTPTLAEECKLLKASGNPEYPPYLWRDPQDETRLVGAVAEFMERLGKEVGVGIQINYVGAWGRVQEETRDGRLDMIAGAFLTMPRLEYMDYLPSMTTTRSVIISPPGANLNYKQWSDLAGKRGLTVVNNSFGEAFDRYAEKHLTIEKVPKLDNALRMLSLKRADYLVYEDAPARAFAARLGIKNLTEAETAISNEPLYVTLSRQSPCNSAELRGRMARAINKLVKEKAMTAALERAIGQWQAQGGEK